MPRRARLRIPGLPLHVIQRGNNKSPCFWNERDCRVYLALLDELADRHACPVHAYVLMTNHVHLLVTPEHVDSASMMMKHLGQRYVQYVNRKRSRSGSLWEGRFRSCVVDSERYLLICLRYIESNPVRAGMVRHPSQFPWSSYATNADGKPSDFLLPREEYSALAVDPEERRRVYRSLFDTPIPPVVLDQIRAATNGGFALGSETFIHDLERRTGVGAAPKRGGRPSKQVA